MDYYFESPENCAKLQTALQRWENTPFAQGAAQCQVGVDCVHFVREVLRESGIDVDSANNIPAYSLTWGIHNQHSELLGWLHADPDVRKKTRRIDRELPLVPGDILGIRTGAGMHHLCIAGTELPHRLWHVPAPGVVTSFEVGPNWKTRCIIRLRLIAE